MFQISINKLEFNYFCIIKCQGGVMVDATQEVMDSGQDVINQRTLLGKPSYRFESCPDTDTRGNRKHTRHCLGNGNKHTEYLSLVGKH